MTLVTAIADGAYLALSWSPSASGNSIGSFDTDRNIFGGLWLQAFVPFLQLTVIVALVRENKSSAAAAAAAAGGIEASQTASPAAATSTASEPPSRAGRFLRRPLLLWLGKISMSLYLVHHPVIYYTVWGHNCLRRGLCDAPINVPDVLDCGQEYGDGDGDGDGDDGKLETCRRERNDYERTLQVPFACIPIVVAVSLALATLLFHCVEEPCRRLLRSTRGGAATATATGRSADDAAANAANAAAKAKQEEFAAVDRTSSLLGAPLLGDGQGRT